MIECAVGEERLLRLRTRLDWRPKIFRCHIGYVVRMSGEIFRN